MAFVDSSTFQQEESYLTLKIFKSTFLLLAGVLLYRIRLSLDRTGLTHGHEEREYITKI